jgi:hypothetical protein
MCQSRFPRRLITVTRALVGALLEKLIRKRSRLLRARGRTTLPGRGISEREWRCTQQEAKSNDAQASREEQPAVARPEVRPQCPEGSSREHGDSLAWSKGYCWIGTIRAMLQGRSMSLEEAVQRLPDHGSHSL